jgi:hypothetical protein
MINCKMHALFACSLVKESANYITLENSMRSYHTCNMPSAKLYMAYNMLAFAAHV